MAEARNIYLGDEDIAIIKERQETVPGAAFGLLQSFSATVQYIIREYAQFIELFGSFENARRIMEEIEGGE
jgi:hypothetical protein